MKKTGPFRGLSFYAIMLIVILALSFLVTKNTPKQQVTVSYVIAQIEAGNMTEVTVNGFSLTAKPRNPAAGDPKEIIVRVSGFWMDKIYDTLQAAKAKDPTFIYDYKEPVDMSTWINLILIILMLGGIGLFAWITYTRQNSDRKSAMRFGRSRARLKDPTKNQVTFKDVAGADEEKE